MEARPSWTCSFACPPRGPLPLKARWCRWLQVLTDARIGARHPTCKSVLSGRSILSGEAAAAEPGMEGGVHMWDGGEMIQTGEERDGVPVGGRGKRRGEGGEGAKACPEAGGEWRGECGEEARACPEAGGERPS